MADTDYTMSEVMDYIMLHLRASGPCSVLSIQDWLVEQCPGITAYNHRYPTETCLPILQSRNVIERLDDGSYQPTPGNW